ncbi:MAG: hypothetical protein LBT34_01415 [Clostridiales Family XIII bacterium]|jgi:hypothetical protein|nr:hypothetical protein [Clostridiales Family XIII bacterium]
MPANIKEKLNQIRQASDENITSSSKALHLLFIILMGCLAGFLAKYFDILQFERVWGIYTGKVFEGLGLLGTIFSVWVFTATLIAVYSQNPISAGVHAFCYLFFLNVTYFIYAAKHYHSSYMRQFIFWTVFAVFAVLLGAVIWYARGGKLISNILAAMPIAFFLAEAARAFLHILKAIQENRIIYGAVPYSVIVVFCILASAALAVALPETGLQSLRTAAISIIAAPIMYFIVNLLWIIVYYFCA